MSAEVEQMGVYVAADAYPPRDTRSVPISRRALVAALAVASYPSRNRIRTAGSGHTIGVAGPLIRELVAALEATLPGGVQWVRDHDRSLRAAERRAAGRR